MTDESKDTVARPEIVFVERTSPPRDSDARGGHGERIATVEVEVKNIHDRIKNVNDDIRDFRSERKWMIGVMAAITAFILGALTAGYFHLADKIWKIGNLSGTPPSP